MPQQRSMVLHFRFSQWVMPGWDDPTDHVLNQKKTPEGELDTTPTIHMILCGVTHVVLLVADSFNGCDIVILGKAILCVLMPMMAADLVVALKDVEAQFLTGGASLRCKFDSLVDLALQGLVNGSAIGQVMIDCSFGGGYIIR